MTDEIDAPLGKPKKPGLFARLGAMRPPKLQSVAMSRPRSWPIARIAFALSAVILAVAYIRIMTVHDPLGGRPSAVVDISSSRNSNAVANDVAFAPPSQPSAVTPAPDAGTDTTTVPSGPQITTVDPDLPDTEVAPVGVQELTRFGVDPNLIEETPNGPIPQIDGAGNTPFSTYARASVTEASAGKPVIAIVVTGLGISESGTLDAIAKLPDNVTLAFAPYGRSLQRTTAAARAEGHEMLLQVPMEPFDYPDNDPGPQTLLTGQSPRANLDKLYWLMARIGGYFGIMNYMGARFTSSAGDFEPLMEEIGTRGLGYLDDGSSNRSVAPQLSGRNLVPFGRGDAEIDANPSRAAIMKKLAELETKAADKGYAIGIASALPVTIDAVTEWAEGLKSRGALLVPVSAIMK